MKAELRAGLRLQLKLLKESDSVYDGVGKGAASAAAADDEGPKQEAKELLGKVVDLLFPSGTV